MPDISFGTIVRVSREAVSKHTERGPGHDRTIIFVGEKEQGKDKRKDQAAEPGTNLFQGLVIDEASSIFGDFELALLNVLAKLPIDRISAPDLSNNKLPGSVSHGGWAPRSPRGSRIPISRSRCEMPRGGGYVDFLQRDVGARVWRQMKEADRDRCSVPDACRVG